MKARDKDPPKNCQVFKEENTQIEDTLESVPSRSGEFNVPLVIQVDRVPEGELTEGEKLRNSPSLTVLQFLLKVPICIGRLTVRK